MKNTTILFLSLIILTGCVSSLDVARAKTACHEKGGLYRIDGLGGVFCRDGSKPINNLSELKDVEGPLVVEYLKEINND